jgi:hypothetical protein
MDKRPGTSAGHLVELVAKSEGRRLIVVIGIPMLFVAWFELTANFGVLILLLAAGLAAFLYTRSTAQKTLAASAYGAGVLLISLFLLELYLNLATGSTEPLSGTATRVLWRAIAGTALIGFGLWLRQTEF